MEELKTNEYLRGIVLTCLKARHLPVPEQRRHHHLRGQGEEPERRVSSYFNREHEPGKTRVLVSKIADIRYIVVNTEEDALLLENNLIKSTNPATTYS